MGTEEDMPYGQGIQQVMRPFIESLIAGGLSVKTIKKHMDNLWLLGGEIIRDVSMNNEHNKILPLEKVRNSIGPDGGPYCQHLNSESELTSYDSTCRKLHNFLEGKNKNG